MSESYQADVGADGDLDDEASNETVILWVRISVALLAGAALAALIASFWVNTDGGYAWNVLGWVAGVPLGFILGLIAAPLGPKDAKRLNAAGQVIAGFLSGFTVSKIDKLFELAVERRSVVEPSFVAPFVLCATATLATAVSVYIARAYVFTGD